MDSSKCQRNSRSSFNSAYPTRSWIYSDVPLFWKRQIEEVSFTRNLWNKLDGKKTAAGAILFVLALALKYFGFLTDEGQFQNLLDTAGAISGIGLVHKLWKKVM